jgi:hypothetical protein
MRPTYENEITLAEEREIRERVEKRWNCRMEKMPVAYRLDFCIMRAGKFIAWAEVKRRKRTFNKHPDTWLSLQKWLAALELNGRTRLPCVFIVKYDDCTAWADMLPKRKFSWEGRDDRNDPDDKEPVLLVPQSAFTVI